MQEWPPEVCDGDVFDPRGEVYRECAVHPMPKDLCEKLYGVCGPEIHYAPGKLVQCAQDCLTFDPSPCPYLGDGVISGDEECDAPNQYLPCKMFGYDSEQEVLCLVTTAWIQDPWPSAYYTGKLDKPDIVCF